MKRKPDWADGLFAAVAFCFVVGLVGMCSAKADGTDDQNIPTITMQGFCDAYRANPLSVEKRIGGKPVILQVTVSSIGGTREAPCIFFQHQDAKLFVTSCRIDLDASEFDKAAEISKGDKVSIRCVYRGVKIVPVFDGGVFVK